MSRKTEKDEEEEKERRRRMTEEDNGSSVVDYFVITSWARDHCFVKLVGMSLSGAVLG